MTKATAYFLDRLRLHLLAQGQAERLRLVRFYRKRRGKKLHADMLSRWLNLHVCPSLDVGLVLLAFAKRRGVITESGTAGALFVYRAPTAPAAQSPARRHLKKYAAAGKAAA